MIFKQYYLGCLAHASYLLGDPETGTAILVDPRRDLDEYLADVEELGLEIRHVFLTHYHADFLAGHLEVAERFGASIHLGAQAEAEFDIVGMNDGDELDLPSFRLRVLETPGHTPESISVLVFDKAKSEEEPWAVLTGDTLFVGAVGRPDLMASIGITAEELATMLYSSLHDKLMLLPDETMVYPAHGAGSMCGKSLGSENHTTIGAQRTDNPSLQPMTVDAFVASVTADQPIAPAYFSFDAMKNRQRHETLSTVKERAQEALSVDRVLEMMRNEPVQVIDTRDAARFSASHLKGTWNLGLDGNFATWAGSVLDHDRPIVVIADPGQETEAVVRLGRIGFDRVVGHVDGGFEAIEKSGAELVRHERIDSGQLVTLLEGSEPPVVVDVRGCGEFEGGHIEGAVHVPLQQLKARLGEIPLDRDVVFVCRTGYRSSVASSVIRALLGETTRDLAGGMLDWPTDRVVQPSA